MATQGGSDGDVETSKLPLSDAQKRLAESRLLLTRLKTGATSSTKDNSNDIVQSDLIKSDLPPPPPSPSAVGTAVVAATTRQGSPSTGQRGDKGEGEAQKREGTERRTTGSTLPDTSMVESPSRRSIGHRLKGNKRKYRPEEIVQQLRHLADSNGDANASYTLGVYYEKGRFGLTQDYQSAAKYYESAAMQGNTRAQNNLGRLYEAGLGVDKNDAVAVKYYARASAGGDAKAMFNLALCYKGGRGVAQSDTMAVKYLQMAADKGPSGIPAPLRYIIPRL